MAKRTLPSGLKRSTMLRMVWLPIALGLFFSIFALAFASTVNMSWALRFYQEKVSTKGFIDDIRGTNTYVNDEMVSEYLFHYEVGDDKHVPGKAYGIEYSLEIGDEVAVEYIKDRPDIVRIAGLDEGMPVFVPLLFFVLVAICFAIAFFMIKRNIGKVWLLENGEFEYATVDNCEPNGVYINDAPQYRVHYSYRVNRQVYDGTFTTLNPDRVTDNEKEIILYSPANPKKAVMLDALPFKVRQYFQRSGELPKDR